MKNHLPGALFCPFFGIKIDEKSVKNADLLKYK